MHLMRPWLSKRNATTVASVRMNPATILVEVDQTSERQEVACRAVDGCRNVALHYGDGETLTRHAMASASARQRCRPPRSQEMCCAAQRTPSILSNPVTRSTRRGSPATWLQAGSNPWRPMSRAKAIPGRMPARRVRRRTSRRRISAGRHRTPLGRRIDHRLGFPPMALPRRSSPIGARVIPRRHGTVDGAHPRCCA